MHTLLGDRGPHVILRNRHGGLVSFVGPFRSDYCRTGSPEYSEEPTRHHEFDNRRSSIDSLRRRRHQSRSRQQALVLLVLPPIRTLNLFIV